jgi:hypothetical protein
VNRHHDGCSQQTTKTEKDAAGRSRFDILVGSEIEDDRHRRKSHIVLVVDRGNRSRQIVLDQYTRLGRS